MLFRVFPAFLPILFKYPLQFSRFTDTELELRFMTECLLRTGCEHESLSEAKETGEEEKLLTEKSSQRTEAQEEGGEWSLGCAAAGWGLGA